MGIKLTAGYMVALQDSPLPPQELDAFSNKEGGTSTDDGLFQMVPVFRGRGRGRLEMMKPGLEMQEEAMVKMTRQLMYGMPEFSFWKLFVQCVVCKAVVLRQGMYTYHNCPNPVVDGLLVQRQDQCPYTRSGLRGGQQLRITRRQHSGEIISVDIRENEEAPWTRVPTRSIRSNSQQDE
ncbi:hypothetical protein FA13DRAFT_1784900 [Coprinellus micaceus]|uniref:Uncharacterized protein n=1 Tax=Coprinellus micaceus TaxID=71717 RepID=A0A4Y7TWM4_COPMI|nr:hypothetical protein FA13DRAFT_1784900 [Coprinellus micaceus]